MKKKYYIIDGFNLLLSNPEIVREIDSKGGKAIIKYSQSLLHKVSNFAAGNKLTIVFDGENPGIGINQENIDVIFAGAYSDADTMIKKIIDSFDFKAHITVVSSDRRVIAYSLQSGTEYISSDDFLLLLEMGHTMTEASESTNKDEIDTDNNTIQKPVKEKSKKESKAQKTSTGSYYTKFNEALDDEEMNDILSDYSIHKIKKKQENKIDYKIDTYQTDSSENQAEANKNKKITSKSKQGDEEEKKMKRISLEDLQKQWEKNDDED